MNISPAFDTLYIIPTDCPYETSMEWGWREPGTVKQKIIEALTPNYLAYIESLIQPNLFLSWTCAGCTKGWADGEVDCPKRKCGLGGKRL
jgi:hypothetical protein